MTDTAELERLAASITPGPWSTDGLSFTVTTGASGLPHGRTFGHGCGNNFICDLNDGEYHEYTDEEEQEANARAIALLPELLAEVIALRAEVERLASHAANGWAQYNHWIERYRIAADERDAALARANAATEMRERAAEAYEDGFPEWDTFSAAATAIRALPIDPDAQKALDKMLVKARGDAIREAASVCSKISLRYWSEWKDGANMLSQGASDGADECDAAILALLNDGGRDD